MRQGAILYGVDLNADLYLAILRTSASSSLMRFRSGPTHVQCFSSPHVSAAAFAAVSRPICKLSLKLGNAGLKLTISLHLGCAGAQRNTLRLEPDEVNKPPANMTKHVHSSAPFAASAAAMRSSPVLFMPFLLWRTCLLLPGSCSLH